MLLDGLAGVWRDRLRRCEASELTVAEFCAREGVGASTHYYWKRKFEEAGESVSAPLFVPALWKDSTANGGTDGSHPTGQPAEELLGCLEGVDDAGPMNGPIRLDSSALARSRIDREMEASIRIDFPNGVVVRIGGDASAETIRSAVESAGRIEGSTEEAGC